MSATPPHSPASEVERRVERDGSFRELLRATGDRVTALRRYAQLQAQKYNRVDLDAPCAICSGSKLGHVRTFHWKAPLEGFKFGWSDLGFLALGVHRITIREAGISFTTLHQVCNRCFGVLRFRRMIASLLKPFGMFFALLGAGVVAFGLVMAAFSLSSPNDRDLGLFAAMVGAPVLALGAVALGLSRGLRIPRTMRTVGSNTFALMSVTNHELG